MEKSTNWTVNLRPQTLNDVYGLDTVKKYLYKSAKDNAWPNVLYFQGQYGSGKTTTAKIAAQMMVCQHPDENGDPCCECPSCRAIIDEKWNRDVIRKNCRDMGGVDGLRDTLKQFTATPPFKDKRKVLILDELQEFGDSGKAAIDTLLTYTESPSSNIKFIFTSMLDPAKESNSNAVKTAFKALGSRSTTFRIPFARYEDIMKFLMASLQRAGQVPEQLDQKFLEALSVIAQNADGSYRTALMLLQQCIDSDMVDKDKILSEMGLIDIQSEMELLLSIMNGEKSENVFNTILNTKDYGQQFNFMLKAVSDAECYRLFGSVPNEMEFLIKQSALVSSHKNFPLLRDGLKKMQDDCGGFLKKSSFILGICKLVDECGQAMAEKSKIVENAKETMPITKIKVASLDTKQGTKEVEVDVSKSMARRRAALAAAGKIVN